jgi:putative ABC transport system permease protein
MILLTLRDLRHRAVRFVVVTLLGSVVFALLFVATGLVEQFNREPYDAVDRIGGDAWVLREGVSGPFTAASTLPVEAGAAIDADAVAPVVTARSSLLEAGADDTEEIVVIGGTTEGLGLAPPTQGRNVEAPGEAVVDDTLSVDIGETVTLAGTPFTVVGKTSDATILAGIPLVFVTLESAQDLAFRTREVVSGFLVEGEVRSQPPETVVLTGDEVAADTLGPLEGAIASIDLVRVLLWIVAVIIIGAVVYLSALERQRDFAVLKAVGASNRTLLSSLALQAVLVAVASVALAAIIQVFLGPVFPLKVRVPARAFWQLPLLAVVMAILASLAGMRRVARSDPALAFAGAGG